MLQAADNNYRHLALTIGRMNDGRLATRSSLFTCTLRTMNLRGCHSSVVVDVMLLRSSVFEVHEILQRRRRTRIKCRNSSAAVLINRIMRLVRPSVRPSVCPVRKPNSKTKKASWYRDHK